MSGRVSRYALLIALGVGAAIGVGAGLRLIGIAWELPGTVHDFTYHPDEVFQVSAMVSMNPFALRLDPGFYNYPSGYMTLGSAVMRVLEAWGIKLDAPAAYLTARLVTALMGVLTIPLVFLAGRLLYGRTVGLAAALLFALLPLHVVHSHYGTVDVPSSFWVCAAIVGAAAILRKPARRTCFLAGVAAGLAAGMKYNCGIVIIAVLTASIISHSGNWRTRALGRCVWIPVSGAVLGLVVASPGLLLWPHRYAGGLLYELRHAATGHGQVFLGRGPGWLDVLSSSFGYGMGVPLLVGSLLGLALAIVRHRREDWVLLAFAVPYFVLISASNVRFTRYTIPLTPVVALLVGRLAVEAYEILREQRAGAVRWAWLAACLVSVLWTTVYAGVLCRLFTLPDTRTQALQWIRANVGPGDSIALPTVPWFYSPPYAPAIVGTPGIQDRYEMLAKAPWKLLVGPSDFPATQEATSWYLPALTSERSGYVVASDYETEDGVRVRDHRALAYIREIRANYLEDAVFAHRLRAFGLDFGPAENLPHDMKYQSPVIRIYRRK